MKRYDINNYHDEKGSFQEMEQEVNGCWIKYSDIELLLYAKEAEIRYLKAEIELINEYWVQRVKELKEEVK